MLSSKVLILMVSNPILFLTLSDAHQHQLAGN